MNTISAEISAILNKRETDMQKLKNYLDAGKTSDEAIVKNVIKKIERAEKTLIEKGYTDFTAFSIDNFIPVNTDEVNPITEVESVEIKDDKSNKTNKNDYTPKKEMEFEKTVKTIKLGVGIKKNTLKKIEGLLPAKSSLKKANINTVVIKLLEEVYKDGKFTVEFNKKDDYKITSYMLPEHIENAITKVHKKTRLPKSEIFNKLLEEALKAYYDTNDR